MYQKFKRGPKRTERGAQRTPLPSQLSGHFCDISCLPCIRRCHLWLLLDCLMCVLFPSKILRFWKAGCSSSIMHDFYAFTRPFTCDFIHSLVISFIHSCFHSFIFSGEKHRLVVLSKVWLGLESHPIFIMQFRNSLHLFPHQ